MKTIGRMTDGARGGPKERPTADQERLLDIYDVAERTRLSVPTLRRALRTGQLAYVRLGRRVLVRRAELERWISASEVPARQS